MVMLGLEGRETSTPATHTHKDTPTKPIDIALLTEQIKTCFHDDKANELQVQQIKGWKITAVTVHM